VSVWYEEVSSVFQRLSCVGSDGNRPTTSSLKCSSDILSPGTDSSNLMSLNVEEGDIATGYDREAVSSQTGGQTVAFEESKRSRSRIVYNKLAYRDKSMVDSLEMEEQYVTVETRRIERSSGSHASEPLKRAIAGALGREAFRPVEVKGFQVTDSKTVTVAVILSFM